MSVRARVAGTLWKWSTRSESRRFQRSILDPAVAQRAYLRSLLRANQGTLFGKEHGFSSFSDPDTYREAVSIHDAVELAPYVDRIRRGEPSVLTADPVLSLAPTSGTSGGAKLIPYTATVRREFGRGIAPWIHDLFRLRPTLLGGPMYWVVTPLCDFGTHGESVVPIGFEADTSYFGRLEERLARMILAVPPETARLGDLESLRRSTLRCLLARRDLRLISIWSPTFLDVLFHRLHEEGGRLVREIHDGVQVSPDRERAREIERHLAGGSPVLEPLWPRLALISCWTDAWAARALDSVRSRFPHVPIQGKGLLATEAFVTLPLSGAPAPVLAVRSHFFEFEPEDGGDTLLSHELVEGREYEVIVTTGGGLYRYRLGDRVRVEGFLGRTPTLRLVGRAGGVSDLHGEKLHEAHVAVVLDRALAEVGWERSFRFLAPRFGAPSRYVLYVEPPRRAPTETGLLGPETIRGRVEAGLCENPHYRYARELGQLAPVEVALLRDGARELYIRGKAQGALASVVKPLSLEPDGGWWERMSPDVLSQV